MPKIRHGRCSKAVPGRKRYHFRRRIGYHPPAGQENAPNPARKVLRGGSGQKKVSFPARNRIPPACRAGKCPKSGAEGAPRRLRAEKGIISGAERDTSRLPGKKMPKIWRGRCFEAAPGRKRYHFRRGIGYHPPAEEENVCLTQKYLQYEKVYFEQGVLA